MKYILIILTHILISQNSFGQNSSRTYLNHGHNFSTAYSYDITEITINSDSTYIRKNWSVSSKKEWKKYKKYVPDIKGGKIKRNGEYYILNEYRNGIKTDFNWTVKFNDKRLNFYYPNKNEKLKISARYKRIE